MGSGLEAPSGQKKIDLPAVRLKAVGSRFITVLGMCGAFPQGLKPTIFLRLCGAAEAAPFQSQIYETAFKARVMKQLSKPEL
jgi:hypothetical protein